MADPALLDLYGFGGERPLFDGPLFTKDDVLPRSKENESYLGGFLASTGWGLGPDLVGVEPNEYIKRFREANPISSVVSQVVGGIAPYALGYGLGATALRAVPLGRAALGGIEAMQTTRPFTARAMSEVLNLAPFEAGRIAIGGLVAPENVGDVALSAAMDLAIAPAVGVGFQFFTGHGAKLPQLPGDGEALRIFPDYNSDASRQEKLAQLITGRANNPNMPEAQANAIDGFIQRLKTDVRLESTKKPVAPLTDGAEHEEFKRIFSGRGDIEKSNLVSRRLTVGPRQFAKTSEWEDIVAKAMLPLDWEQFVQFPRAVSFKADKTATTIDGVFRKQLVPGPDDWLLRRESGDGLFVMAKKVQGGSAPATGDVWLTLKTNDPARIMGKTVYGNAAEKRGQFWTKMTIEEDAELAAKSVFAQDFQKITNDIKFMDYVQPGLAGLAKYAAELMPEWARNAAKEGFGSVANIAKYSKKYIAPTMFQFTHNPRANWALQIARTSFEMAKARSELAIYGPQGGPANRSILRSVLAVEPNIGGIEARARALTNADMPLVTAVIRDGVSLDELAKVNPPAPVLEFFRELYAEDAKRMAELTTVQKLTGAKVREVLPEHYGVSRSWRGEYRLRLVDEQGRTLEMASGVDKPLTIKNAEDLINLYKAEGKTLRVSPEQKAPWLSDRETDLDFARMLNFAERVKTPRVYLKDVMGPRYEKLRTGVGGFAGQRDVLTRRELMDSIKSHIKRDNNLAAELVTRHYLTPHLMKLGNESYNDFGQTVARINDLAMKPGPLAKAQNAFADKLLAPALGKNSASKIASAMNAAEAHLSLYSFNMGYVALQALQPIQTLLAHLSLLKGAAPETLANLYTHSLVAGADGRPRGLVSALEPIKVLGQALRNMRNPEAKGASPELKLHFDRAATDGTITAGSIEEYIGQSSEMALKLRDVTKGDVSFTKWLGSMSRFAPAIAERFSRTVSFSAGHLVGSKWFGLEGEQLYQFAKRATERTNYLYTTADRPRIFTGAFGSSFGLFKNWLAHNIFDWAQYTSEAFARGNWAPLLWATGSNAAVAGVAGLPLYGLADGASRILSNKSIMEHLYSGYAPGDDTSRTDALYFGLPAFLGVSFQASASSPFSNPPRDMEFMYSWALIDRMTKIGKFAGYAMDQWYAQGEHPIKSDRTRDLFQYAFSPRVAYKAWSQVEDGALKSIRNGRPLIQGVTENERVANALGFTPLKIAKAYELSEDLWKEIEKRNALVTTFGEAWYQAQARQDQGAMQEVLAKAMASGVDLSRVFKSASERQRRDSGEEIERNFRAIANANLRRVQMGISRD